MKISLLVSPLAAAIAMASSAAARGVQSNHDMAGNTPLGFPSEVAADDTPLPDVKGGFLVEFKDVQSARTASFSARAQEDQHAAFHEHLSKRARGGIKYQTLYTFTDSRVFVGLSLKLNNPADVAALYDAADVKAVYPLRRYRPAAYKATRASEDAARSAVKDTFAPHVMTQVDRLHEKGYLGKGIRVAVIDTGIDYTHPALNGGKPAGQRCFKQPDCQVVEGYDLVGDNYTGENNPVPDSDPFADCAGSGHGTHTSGTIIANDTVLGFTGVMPAAKLSSYRVFGCEQPGLPQSVSDDVLIAAMARALADPNDLMSISIGGPAGFTDSATSLVATRISALGVPVIISAGNSGTSGAFFASGPASTSGGISVASFQNTALSGYKASVAGVDGLTELFALTPAAFTFPAGQSNSLPVYAITKTPTANDGCDPLPASTPDLSGKIVLVMRGGCNFSIKQQNIFDKGGRYVLIFNTPPPATITYTAPLNNEQQSAFIFREEGLKLQAAFAAGKDVRVIFDSTVLETRTSPDGGLLSGFTNFGPTNEMSYSPHIGAPGGNILSTWPVALGSYSIISGTSMAAPLLAGVVGQYIAINGKTPTAKIRSRLVSHATPVVEDKSAGALQASVGRAGAGLVQAYDAIFATASAVPAILALNDTDHFKADHFVTISNIGKKVEKFHTVHMPSGTAQTSNSSIPNYNFFNLSPVPLTSGYAGVKISPSSFTLAPGASKKVKLTFTPPAVNQGNFPLYSGYVKFVSSTGVRATLSVPYQGLSASITKRPVLDSTSNFFEDFTLPALNQNDATPFAAGEPTVDLSSEESQPQLIFRLLFGSPLFELSLVSADTQFNATIKHTKRSLRSVVVSEDRLVRRRMNLHNHIHQQRDLAERAPVVASNKTVTVAASNKTVAAVPETVTTKPSKAALFSDTVTIGAIRRDLYQSRNTEDAGLPQYVFAVTDQVTKPDGSTFTVPQGRYRVLLRAQRTYTDAKLAASYDSWLSEPFTYAK